MRVPPPDQSPNQKEAELELLESLSTAELVNFYEPGACYALKNEADFLATRDGNLVSLQADDRPIERTFRFEIPI